MVRILGLVDWVRAIASEPNMHAMRRRCNLTAVALRLSLAMSPWEFGGHGSCRNCSGEVTNRMSRQRLGMTVALAIAIIHETISQSPTFFRHLATVKPN